ncbi:MAG: hypothetical protein ABI970_26155, partial [Chloroflexota bacterium]
NAAFARTSFLYGGNAAYIMPHLQQWYGKVIEYTDWREFAGLHPADLNAAGGCDWRKRGSMQRNDQANAKNFVMALRSMQ